MRRFFREHSTAVKLVFTAALLGALVSFVGWRDLVAGLAHARWQWLLAMYAVVLVNFAVMAACLRRLLAQTGVGVSFGRVLLANALANLYALVLPGDLMGGVSKWVTLSAATGERAKVLSAIVLNKLALAIPPLVFGTFALALDSPLPGLPVGETAFAAALVAVSGLVVVLHPRVGARVDGWARGVAERLPAAAGPVVAKLLGAFAAVRASGGRDHLAVFALALVAFWLGILSFLCATRALGLAVPVVTLVWISLALFLARLLPVTFNNLGVREGLLILALGTSRAEPALAVGVGLLMFSNTVWIGLLGAGCQVALALGWVRLADEGEAGAMLREGLDAGDS